MLLLDAGVLEEEVHDEGWLGVVVEDRQLMGILVRLWDV